MTQGTQRRGTKRHHGLAERVRDPSRQGRLLGRCLAGLDAAGVPVLCTRGRRASGGAAWGGKRANSGADRARCTVPGCGPSPSEHHQALRAAFQRCMHPSGSARTRDGLRAELAAERRALHAGQVALQHREEGRRAHQARLRWGQGPTSGKAAPSRQQATATSGMQLARAPPAPWPTWGLQQQQRQQPKRGALRRTCLV